MSGEDDRAQRGSDHVADVATKPAAPPGVSLRKPAPAPVGEPANPATQFPRAAPLPSFGGPTSSLLPKVPAASRKSGVTVPLWALVLVLVTSVGVVTALYVTRAAEQDNTATSATPIERAQSEPTQPMDGDASESPSTESAPSPATIATSEPPPNDFVLTATPSADPEELADQLNRAIEILWSDTATADEHRLAGEFEQLASRTLARTGASFRRATLTSLDGDASTIVANDVTASAQLFNAGEAQQTLPEFWRIVEPPPAEELMAYYRSAADTTGVDWQYLAAIHLVETRMGRIRGDSSAGAQGPMQFMPETWQAYGGGGDIQDAQDSILAAGRMLRTNGAPNDMYAALYSYNPSDAYVRAVLSYADNIRRFPWFYRSYWSWRVLYRHVDGTYVIPVGYPNNPAELL